MSMTVLTVASTVNWIRESFFAFEATAIDFDSGPLRNPLMFTCAAIFAVVPGEMSVSYFTTVPPRPGLTLFKLQHRIARVLDIKDGVQRLGFSLGHGAALEGLDVELNLWTLGGGSEDSRSDKGQNKKSDTIHSEHTASTD